MAEQEVTSRRLHTHQGGGSISMQKVLRLGGEVLAPLIAAAAWALGLYGQRIAGREVEWNWIAAAFVVAFIILVVLHINGLNSELSGLKEKRVDLRLELTYDEAQRWYRINVENQSQKASAENVQVKLEGIEPIPQDFHTIELPCRLGRKDAPKDHRQDEVISINPGAPEPFDLVKYLGNNTIVIFTTVFQQQVRLKDAQPYRFKIRVTVGNPNDQMQGGGSRRVPRCTEWRGV